MTRTKRTKPSSLLTIAAAVSCCIGIAESASVRGGGGDNDGRRRKGVAADNAGILRPEREPRPQRPHHRPRQQRSLQRSDEDTDTHWWHDNLSDEKDIVYHPIDVDGPDDATDGGEVAFPPQSQMQLNSGTVVGNGGTNDEYEDNGKSGFSVYSVAVSNDPDTSELPHAIAPMVVKHYPLWGVKFNGCASSSNPPETYVENDANNAANNDDEGDSGIGKGVVIQYLFDTKLGCCIRWFQEDLNGCVRTSQVEEVEEMEEYQDSLNVSSV